MITFSTQDHRDSNVVDYRNPYQTEYTSHKRNDFLVEPFFQVARIRIAQLRRFLLSGQFLVL